MIGGLFSGGVEVTVTYEALDVAAAETLSRTVAAERALDELRSQSERMKAIWQGEASDSSYMDIQKMIENAEKRLQGFRQHAQNLQLICQNYIQARASIAGTIQTLAEDVIV